MTTMARFKRCLPRKGWGATARAEMARVADLSSETQAEVFAAFAAAHYDHIPLRVAFATAARLSRRGSVAAALRGKR